MIKPNWFKATTTEQKWLDYTVEAVRVNDQWKFKARKGWGVYLDWPFDNAADARACCEDDYQRGQERLQQRLKK